MILIDETDRGKEIEGEGKGGEEGEQEKSMNKGKRRKFQR